MQPRETLTLKSAALAKVAPHEWREFLQALDAYSSAAKETLIHSPLSELQINQGRVQSLVVLHKLLTDARANSEKITQKDKP